MSTQVSPLSTNAQELQKKITLARTEIGKVIVGQTTMIDRLFIGLLADGHILLEGLPGLAKTLAVTTLAKVIQCEFKRVQFTPDLLPADLIGTSIYNLKEGEFKIQKGPIFTNILLADEINRAPAKVQSALLEVMQEKQVTIGGETFQTGKPYLVLATQNPIEQEGTYSLPEAQTDRFMMKVIIGYPNREEEKEILERMGKTGKFPQVNPILTGEEILTARQIINNEVFVDDKIKNYILDIVFATRNPKDFGVKIDGLLLYGASPRASIALETAGRAFAFLEGRNYVSPHDIKSIAPDILRHRLKRSYEAEAEDISTDDIIKKILETLIVP